MAKKKITEIAAAELKDFLHENGYELYNIEFVKEVKDFFLRVYIDWERGQNGEERYIGTDDCEKVSRFLSGRLDELDPVESAYYLEVSSPGLDRELISENDYLRYSGREVDVSLYKAMDGRKKLTGTLKGVFGDKIVITDADGIDIEIPKGIAVKTKLKVVF